MRVRARERVVPVAGVDYTRKALGMVKKITRRSQGPDSKVDRVDVVPNEIAHRAEIERDIAILEMLDRMTVGQSGQVERDVA